MAECKLSRIHQIYFVFTEKQQIIARMAVLDYSAYCTLVIGLATGSDRTIWPHAPNLPLPYCPPTAQPFSPCILSEHRSWPRSRSLLDKSNHLPFEYFTRDMNISQSVGTAASKAIPNCRQQLEVNLNAGSNASFSLAKPIRACTNCVRAKAKCSPCIRAGGKCERY